MLLSTPHHQGRRNRNQGWMSRSRFDCTSGRRQAKCIAYAIISKGTAYGDDCLKETLTRMKFSGRTDINDPYLIHTFLPQLKYWQILSNLYFEEVGGWGFDNRLPYFLSYLLLLSNKIQRSCVPTHWDCSENRLSAAQQVQWSLLCFKHPESFYYFFHNR